MIAGGWAFVWAAYAVGAVALVALTAAVIFHARRWARLERQLDAAREVAKR